jgi:hypothetical protein
MNGGDDAAQQSVWKDVLNIQNGLTRTLRDTVTNNESATSLELALEHSSVQEKRKLFFHALQDIVDKDPQSIGFVYAIDGEVRGAEIYGSHALFLSMWPKLLRAASTEALLTGGGGSKTASPDSVQLFLDNARHGKSAEKQINDRTRIQTYKSDSSYTFITRDSKYRSAMLHESVVKE